MVLPLDTLASNTLRGLLYIIIGMMLLLHTLDIITVGVSIVLIVASFLLILYGIRIGNFYQTTMNIWKRYRAKKPPSTSEKPTVIEKKKNNNNKRPSTH